MEYLTRWRMLLACDRLKNSADSISAITGSLSYESESALCKAFRRVIGCSPRQYARHGTPRRLLVNTSVYIAVGCGHPLSRASI